MRQGSGGLCRPCPGSCTSTPSRCLLWEPLARLPSLRYPRAAPAQVTPHLLRTAGWPVPARLSFCELRAHSCVLGTRWTPGGHPWSIAFIGRQMLNEAERAIGRAWAQHSQLSQTECQGPAGCPGERGFASSKLGLSPFSGREGGHAIPLGL